MRLKIRAMGNELKAGINKIPCTPLRTSSNFAFHHRVLQSNESQLDSWARLYMSILTHRSWMLACHVGNTGSFVSPFAVNPRLLTFSHLLAIFSHSTVYSICF
jgi:hypothetical protein